MDMWSIGIILGELLVRRPLLPGNDAKHQLELIFHLIGFPSEEEISKIQDIRIRSKMEHLSRKGKSRFDKYFRSINEDAVDLIRKLLVFNPEERLTA